MCQGNLLLPMPKSARASDPTQLEKCLVARTFVSDFSPLPHKVAHSVRISSQGMLLPQKERPRACMRDRCRTPGSPKNRRQAHLRTVVGDAWQLARSQMRMPLPFRWFFEDVDNPSKDREVRALQRRTNMVVLPPCRCWPRGHTQQPACVI